MTMTVIIILSHASKPLKFDISISLLIHKIVHLKDETPPAIYDLVLPPSEIHNYNTSYATNQNLYRPASRTNYGLARFKVTASKIWEKVPVV